MVIRIAPWCRLSIACVLEYLHIASDIVLYVRIKVFTDVISQAGHVCRESQHVDNLTIAFYPY